MKRTSAFLIGAFLLGTVICPAFLPAQGTRADYSRSSALRAKFLNKIEGNVTQSGWIGDTHRFWYKKSATGGAAFVAMDAETLEKRPAFDHEKLAASLTAALGTKIEAGNLPLAALAFVDEGKALEFEAGESRWKCTLADYTVTKTGPARFRMREGQSPFAPFPAPPFPPEEAKASPDGKWDAFIKNHNVWLRSRGGAGKAEVFPLSWEGFEGDAYVLASLSWSPDSKKLAAGRIRPGYKRLVHYVESSPSDQLQPKHHTLEYLKPGDEMDRCRPVLFDVESRRQSIVDNALFPDAFYQARFGPFRDPEFIWRKDGRAFTFEYNQRGHQAYRVIEVDAATGIARALINEETKTFFCYSGKKFRHDIEGTGEIIWMSERDGWNHLYLYDAAAGAVKNQITRGEWVVRDVDFVDEAARQIWFRAGGVNPGEDPYFVHYYRINFDGTGLTPLTEGQGTHEAVFSSDRRYYVDIWSRVDSPPVCELRRTEDRKLLAEVERADIRELLKAGWRAPESFVAKGRDGRTDIWGVIIRPTNFDPRKKYPVIENIYAGPHDSFVPKAFIEFHEMQALAELGFIVSQVDGMGTSNRSKAFHDVCWKNIGDAGFPDRILWHKAVAAKYPGYDISRVGIYGGSAGGQNSTGALLFHPEFYKAAVSFAGCHDNRMDKIWWNEQWMGYPIGPEYSASSNVDNAYRLQGKLLLILPELDTNVDPSSTMQVVDALLKADKYFDFLIIPGGGHGAGRREPYKEYGDKKRNDFFVRHLLGVEPPDWNKSVK